MSKSTVVTELPGAAITGLVGPDGAREYRGIRYATAARGRPPVGVVPAGPVDATEFGPICPQVPGFLEQTLGLDASSMSEDCLSLNIFCPPGTDPDSKLPVLFWIHGGAYTNGAGSLAWYRGERLAARGAVVVTFNYRLGILGFVGDTNFGVQDMVSALTWVHSHIATFGGDPGNVTIFGESAGGSAVTTLMATEHAGTLFHKAWAMSPSIGQLRSAERAEEIVSELLAESGCKGVDEMLALPVERLLEIQASVLARPAREFDWFAPTADGVLVAKDLLGAAASCPVPFVIGTNRDENKLWAAFHPDAASATEEQWMRHLERTFGDRAPLARRVYESLRPGESPHFLMSAVNTDTAFRARAWSLVDDRCAAAMPTWMYWFTWASPAFGGILGSCHALDIPFAFDNLDAPGGEMFTGDDPARHGIARRFADEIADFAVHGHPSWAQYDRDLRHTLQIDTVTELRSDPESDIRELFTPR